MNHSQQTPPPQHGRLSKNVDRPKGTPFFLERDIASWDLHAIDPDRHRPSSQQQLPLRQLDLELRHAAQQTPLWPGNLQHPTAAPSTTCPLLPSWMELQCKLLAWQRRGLEPVFQHCNSSTSRAQAGTSAGPTSLSQQLRMTALVTPSLLNHQYSLAPMIP